MSTEKAVEKAKDLAEKGEDIATGVIDSAASEAKRRVRSAKGAVDEALDDGRDALENAMVCAKDMIRQHPFTAVAVVGAIAYLWGKIRG
ncbi:MAG TPA: hypothetical protein VGC69_16490 [Bordetella sp.]